MKKIIFAAAVVAFASSVSVSAMAQSASIKSTNNQGTQILGDTDIRVKAQNVRTLATGKNNKASTNIGSIGTGTQILGDTTIKVNAKNVTTMATGSDNTATTNIGTIGKTN